MSHAGFYRVMPLLCDVCVTSTWRHCLCIVCVSWQLGTD